MISHTVIHYSRCNILARNSLVPCCLHIEIQSGLTTVLACVAQIPLKRKVGISWNFAVAFGFPGLVDWVWDVANCCGLLQSAKSTLHPLEARLLNGSMDLR